MDGQTNLNNCTPIITLLLVLALPLTAAAQVAWVPVVAHGPGSGGSRWRSDVSVLNLCPATAVVELRLHTPAGVESESFSVGGGTQQLFADVVAQLVAGDQSGPLEVRSDLQVTVTSRTYNLAGAGTFGQALDAVAPEDGADAGETVSLQQLEESARFRTNLGLLNMGDSTARVAVTLYQATGTTVGSYDLELAPGELVQDNRPFSNRFDQTDIAGGYATINVTSGAEIYAYASLVDNGTGDATTITMKPYQGACSSPEPGELVVETYDPERAYNGLTLLAQIGVGEPPRIVEVDMDGTIVWQLDLPPELEDLSGGIEAQSLANGNVLLTVFNRGVYELTRAGQLVWSQETAKISHDGDRLSNGNTIYVYGMGDQQSDAQVTEVDRSGRTVWQWFAADHYGDRFPNAQAEGWSHINAVQRLASGDTLVSLRNFSLTAIVDPSGAVVEEYDWSSFGQRTMPHEPVALANGNILVCLHAEPLFHAAEVDRSTGATVWTYTHPTPLRTTRDCDRLPNGNTLIVGVKDEGDGEDLIDESTIIEVTPDGEVVWQLTLHGVSVDTSPGLLFKAERVGTDTVD